MAHPSSAGCQQMVHVEAPSEDERGRLLLGSQATSTTPFFGESKHTVVFSKGLGPVSWYFCSLKITKQG